MPKARIEMQGDGSHEWDLAFIEMETRQLLPILGGTVSVRVDDDGRILATVTMEIATTSANPVTGTRYKVVK